MSIPTLDDFTFTSSKLTNEVILSQVSEISTPEGIPTIPGTFGENNHFLRATNEDKKRLLKEYEATLGELRDIKAKIIAKCKSIVDEMRLLQLSNDSIEASVENVKPLREARQEMRKYDEKLTSMDELRDNLDKFLAFAVRFVADFDKVSKWMQKIADDNGVKDMVEGREIVGLAMTHYLGHEKFKKIEQFVKEFPEDLIGVQDAHGEGFDAGCFFKLQAGSYLLS
jgi:hypothetical protein